MTQPVLIPYFHNITDDALVEFYHEVLAHPVIMSHKMRVPTWAAKQLAHYAFNLAVSRMNEYTRDKYLTICNNILAGLPEEVRQVIEKDRAERLSYNDTL